MAWTDEQIAGAGNWLAQNIGNPDVVRQEVARLGINQDDLLRAAQTQNAGITMGQVQQYMTPPASGPSGPQLNTKYQANPYLDQMAQGITLQANRNLNEQIMPGIRSQAIAAGGFGDARQGVAEGLAIGRTQDALSNSLANLYGNDYQQAMNRNLQQYLGELGADTQRYGIDTNAATSRYGTDQNNATQRYGLDLNNGTQRYGIDTNAATSRYGTDKGYEVGMANANASMANAQANQAIAQGNLALGQQKYGTDLMLGLIDRQMGYGGSAIQLGTNIQDTPYNNYQRFNQQANSMGQGFATSNQSSNGYSDPLTGAAGLARMGQSWLNQSGNVGGNAAQTQDWTYAGNAGGANPAGNIDWIYG